MPELPEVETIRRDLEREVVGRKVKEVVVTNLRCIRRHKTAADFTGRIEGRKVTAVDRRGKYLLVRLDGTADILVIHLGMSGQLLTAKSSKSARSTKPARQPAPKHTHVVLRFTQGAELRYVDPRTFGELFVTTTDALEDAVPELAHLGFDPLVGVMSWQHFQELLAARRTKLKPLLMDQRFLAGIGNMYADEILWAAGLRYDRPADSLTGPEVRRLYRAMVETLQDAIKHRGSSLADEQYRDLYGEVGDYQSRHNVYDREGKPCPRCRGAIVRLKWQGRSTFLCPRCQA